MNAFRSHISSELLVSVGGRYQKWLAPGTLKPPELQLVESEVLHWASKLQTRNHRLEFEENDVKGIDRESSSGRFRHDYDIMSSCFPTSITIKRGTT